MVLALAGGIVGYAIPVLASKGLCPDVMWIGCAIAGAIIGYNIETC